MTPDPLATAREAREHSRNGFLSAVDADVAAREAVSKVRQHHRQNHWGLLLEQAIRRKV